MDDRDLSLITSPLNMARNKLRDVVPYKPETLANKARRFLTLGAVYAERERFAKTRDILPTYEQWLRTFMSPADAKKEAARARQEWAERNARPTMEPIDD